MKTNVSPQGVSRLRLISYQIEGVAGPSVYYVGIRNQETTGLMGNTSQHSFPLLVDQAPVTSIYLNNPIIFQEGNNRWNSAHELQFTVEMFDPLLVPNPGFRNAVFSSMTMLFYFDDTAYPDVQERGEEVKIPKPENNRRWPTSLPGPSQFNPFYQYAPGESTLKNYPYC